MSSYISALSCLSFDISFNSIKCFSNSCISSLSIFPSKLISPFLVLFDAAWITFAYILFVIANVNNNIKNVLFIFLYLINKQIEIIADIIISNINIFDDFFPANGHIPLKILSFSSLFVFSLFLSASSVSSFSSVFSVSLFVFLSFLIFISICFESSVIISTFCSSFTVFKFFMSIFVSVFSLSLLHNNLIFNISSLPLLLLFVNMNFPFFSLYSKFPHDFSALKFSFVTFSKTSLSYSNSPLYVYNEFSVLGIFMLISISSPFFICSLLVFISIVLFSSPAYDTRFMQVIINIFTIKNIFFIFPPNYHFHTTSQIPA